MELANITKNQHFIPQVEQRFNAIDTAISKEKQRIYVFSVQNRESYLIRLESSKGVKIEKNLSFLDLFSFDVLGKEAERYNFENLFQDYESDINSNTESLLNKITNKDLDIKSEILKIFASKMLNFVRNPYSVNKVINSFPHVSNYYPTDPVHYCNFEKIIKGKKPHQEYLCKYFNISEYDYIKWLATIFMLLNPLENGKPNYLNQVIKNLYESKDLYIMVIVYTYDRESCILSDRGYSNPLPDGDYLSFDFNLRSDAFIRYMFGDINKIAPKNTPKRLIESYKLHPKSINIDHVHNDLNILDKYNKNVFYQCFSHVYNSKPTCYGLSVV